MITRKYLSFFTAIATGVCLISVSSANAQVPTTAEPGIIMRDLGEERRAPSRLDDVIMFDDDDVDGAEVSIEKVFTLQKIMLDGSTVYNHEAINLLVEGHIGQQVSFADLNAITRSITRLYRDDGYMFSRAILPPQEIKDGIVHLQVIEGQLTEVEVVGDFKDYNNLVQALADKIRSVGPTNSKQLERYLLLIDDLPGIKARSLLQASETPGGGKLIITVEQEKFEGSLSVDNRGSKFLGRTRGTAVGAFNSIFGIHDRTTLRAILSKDTSELRFFDISHEEQLGTEGVRIKGRFAVTNTEPGASLDINNVEGDSRLFNLEVLYPILRGRQYNLNLIGGFTAINSESDILGLDISEDRVRYLSAGGRFDFTDTWAGVTQIDLEVAQGVDWFNATDDGLGRTRQNGEHDFIRVNASAIRIQNLPGGFSMLLSAAGQYSPDTLLSSEEFSVGGGQFGRAYDSGEIAGDQGISGALELRYGGLVLHDYLKAYQLYSYYDLGKVWNDDPAVTENGHASLASVGLGVRFNLKYDVSGYLEVNKPLTRRVSAEGDDDARLFFSLLKRF